MTRARLGRISWFPVLALTLASGVASPDAAAQQQSSRDQPFFGVTTDGNLIPDLFPFAPRGFRPRRSWKRPRPTSGC